MTHTSEWTIFWALPHNEGMHVLWHKGESRIIFAPDEKTPGNSLMANLILEQLNSGADLPEYHENGDWIVDHPEGTGPDDNGVLILDIDGDVRLEILDSDDPSANLALAEKVAMILNSTDFSKLASLPLVRIPPTLPAPFGKTLHFRRHG